MQSKKRLYYQSKRIKCTRRIHKRGSLNMTAVKHAHDNYQHITDAYSESSQTSKMELFAKKINGF